MTSDPRPVAAPTLNLRSAAVTALPAAGMSPPSGELAGRASAARAKPAHRSSLADLAPASAPPTDLLPRAYFLSQLRREMRRADRTRTPLSLIVYRLARSTGPQESQLLQATLASNMRETDVLGELGPGTLAVIRTDTPQAGLERFAEKIDAAAPDLPYSIESATYPDHLFDGLSALPAEATRPNPLLLEQRATQDGYWLKRPLDIIGALVALALFAPVMLLAALAVKLTSKGPVIFRQTRLGRDGMPFVFYKFRSMVTNGDETIHRQYVASLIRGENEKVNQQDAANPLYKIKHDPRVTRVGRFIRKTSIDELPQLFNVLKGDMSLVGPRPPLPYEAENYHSWHLRRVLDIRPGMTGLWQVEGRGRMTFDEMVRMDLRYIRHCSLSLDLRILAKTAPVVLSCDGAS